MPCESPVSFVLGTECSGYEKFACLNACQVGIGSGAATGGAGEYELCFEIDGEYYGARYGTRYEFTPEGWNEVEYSDHCAFLAE